MRGMGRVFKRGPTWWISFYNRGREHRESSGSESEHQARKLLKRRLGEITTGKFIPNEDRLTFEEIKEGLLNDYKVNDRRSLSTMECRIAHLKLFFGLDRATDITVDRVKSYQVHRLEERAAHATLNREVACLNRMLSLAVESGKLSRKPRFQLLEGEKVRQGFLEHGDFLAVLGNLPKHLSPVVEFLYRSGWRKGEAQKLEWRDVALADRVIRLRIENSKNKESRVLPLTGRLWEVIQERAKDRRLDCPYVFHRNGTPIGKFRKAWNNACRESGLEGVLVHDLRRCAARNLSRAGVPESVAMEMTGHKTRSMYRRYRIVDERDLREATEKLQAHLDEQPKASVVTPMANARKQAIG
jgi:integrase